MTQALPDAVADERDTGLRTLELEILLGRLHPRERLVEDEWMARLGARRHQVRAALTALDQMGLVERRSNRGAAVRQFDVDEVVELTGLRAELHRLAV
ncbi:MAG: GntR family transcriptional regulator [Pseudomonadota bacterium]